MNDHDPPRTRRSRGAHHRHPGSNVQKDGTTDTAIVAQLDDIRPPALRAWRCAVAHLAERGLPPLPPEHVRRALICRGWWR